MRRRIGHCAPLLLLACAAAASLAEESEEDLFAGFDDFTIEQSAENSAADRNWDFGGLLAHLGSYSYRLNSAREPGLAPYEGFSKMRSLLRLEGELRSGRWQLHGEGSAFRDWIYHNNREIPPRAEEQHGSEAEWGELYIRGQVGEHWEVKSGRQLLIWGRSDNLRVLDQINPLDLREPGSSDIEELRLPVAMTRVRYSRAPWTFEGVAIHEVRYHKLPAIGSEFRPSGTPPLPHVRAGSGWASERAFSITGVFPGWDFSLHHAQLWDDQPRLDLTQPLQPVLRHNRLDIRGFSFNQVLGAWLLKGEYARVAGIKFTQMPDEEWTRTDKLLGIEYGGFENTQIGLEASRSSLEEWLPVLAEPPASTEREAWLVALRINRSFLHDRLSAIFVSMLAGASLRDNPLTRLQLSYELSDGCSLDFGLVLYGDSEHPEFGGFDDRDRLLLGLKSYF